MEKIIIDTSIAVKWYTQEEATQQARNLLDDYIANRLEIVAPDIIGLELANALYFGAGFKTPLMERTLRDFYSLQLSYVFLSEMIVQEAAKYMEKFHLAIYDALFIAVAEEEKIPLITADKKHHKKEFSKYIKYLS